jgi:hypothetical protein
MNKYQQTENMMQGMAQALDTFIEENTRKRYGFALLVFEFETPGLTSYVANANREDMIEALLETVERLKSNEDIPMAIGEA